MHNEETQALLVDRAGRAIPLKGVSARARLEGVFAEVEVEQRYENTSTDNIEAVYTFPLPIGAVLLGLELTLGERTLAGMVIERKQAQASYEDAITDGDTAIMLESTGLGLYTMSVGNLLAGERCTIRYRYALALRWQGDALRLAIPTTIAPRYGNAAAAGLQPHEIPTTDYTVEYPFDIAMTIAGELAQAELSSPSHALKTSFANGECHASLSRQGALDRDFVLALKPTRQHHAMAAADRGAHVACAALRLPVNRSAEAQPLSLKVVIDCSGSMQGTSIAQARKAALEIMHQLRADDEFNVVLFGDHHRQLFPALVPATPANVGKALVELAQLQADLGGTEIDSAMQACYRMSISESHAHKAVLLITDGQVHDYRQLFKDAAASQHRVFTVGVGSAVGEDLVRGLATRTGGACILVSPQEGMAEAVLGQFHRLRQPSSGQVAIDWGMAPTWASPLPETVFEGDTVIVWAGFDAAPQGSVRLMRDGECLAQAEFVAAPAALPRMAAAQRLELLDQADEKLALALEHQLLTPQTSFLVIAEREVKADALPQLQQVPQMAPAGWVAAVQCAPVMASAASFSALADMDVARCAAPAMVAGGALAKKSSKEFERHWTPTEFIARLERQLQGVLDPAELPRSWQALEQLGLPTSMTRGLDRLLWRNHCDQAAGVLSFLYALSGGPLASHFSRSTLRLLLVSRKAGEMNDDVVAVMQALFAQATSTDWQWLEETEAEQG